MEAASFDHLKGLRERLQWKKGERKPTRGVRMLVWAIAHLGFIP